MFTIFLVPPGLFNILYRDKANYMDFLPSSNNLSLIEFEEKYNLPYVYVSNPRYAATDDNILQVHMIRYPPWRFYIYRQQYPCRIITVTSESAFICFAMEYNGKVCIGIRWTPFYNLEHIHEWSNDHISLLDRMKSPKTIACFMERFGFIQLEIILKERHGVSMYDLKKMLFDE
jgi:hypothetical protein